MLLCPWGKGNTQSLLAGVQTCSATKVICMEVPKKVKINLPHDQAVPLLGILPTDSVLLQRYLFIHIHRFSINNSQKKETV